VKLPVSIRTAADARKLDFGQSKIHIRFISERRHSSTKRAQPQAIPRAPRDQQPEALKLSLNEAQSAVRILDRASVALSRRDWRRPPETKAATSPI
jgi:hypothetical protein